ncbi:hypothetical protein [Mangrovicella endophytica]|uniref:hypothetical protein n=1 Tax=Mangrovicella endophytica TaxID=2066697 RepID=UPI0012FFEA7C|nr:hypothetical protein [Mangrovicella endophytica]
MATADRQAGWNPVRVGPPHRLAIVARGQSEAPKPPRSEDRPRQLEAARPSSSPPRARKAELEALRAQIARIEGELPALLEAPASPPGRNRDAGAAVEPDLSAAERQALTPLRRRLPRAAVPLGVAEADRALGGGFPAEGLSEIHLDATRDSGTGAGFVLALASLFADGRPVLWAAPSFALNEGGLPYLPGLDAFGAPRLILVRTRRLEEAAWAAEEAARSGALSLVVLETLGNPACLTLDGTRRLHLRARQAGLPLVLLRQGGRADATAAPLRLRLRAAAAPPAPLRGKLVGPPVFDVSIEKSRNPQRFQVEWNPDERRFQPVTATGADARPRLPVPLDRPDPAAELRSRLAVRRVS